MVQIKNTHLKYFGFTFIGIILMMAVYYQELIRYVIQQGLGQLKIVYQARDVDEVLKDVAFPDSLKQKLKLVMEIRRFAFDSLGINPTDNYTRVYNQKGKPILWIVTACEPYKLKAKEWEFPIVGRVAYKGFFDYSNAIKEEQKCKKQGFETSIDEVAGWSTLGWFQDPILTSMLNRYEGSLANLIIHELAHGTLFVKNNVDFNENLASFVGDQGAEMFLKHRFGLQSKELDKYRQRKNFYKQYSQLLLNQSKTLDSLYSRMDNQMSLVKKQTLKRQFFKRFKSEIIVLYKRENINYKGLEKELSKINNTFYMDEKRYREKQNQFEMEFKTKFNSDFKAYFKYLK